MIIVIRKEATKGYKIANGFILKGPFSLTLFPPGLGNQLPFLTKKSLQELFQE